MSCPICGKPTDATCRPFCSRRCADVDLHRWLSGRYVIPAEAGTDDDPATDQPPAPRPH
ncbi:MAG: DNA gyrase inhibitor YacG [Rhodobacteraceae bacterium CG2_30_10_405]|nr:DNA gyrase inhibitor YacG [Rhodobacterales bacterium]NCO17612.1 DNA gyrase inhibitor YacG [Alphaproteobacteria bacterium]OIQ05022.1 MAG: DNA gyrase inhibitor YacG [Rhodobacteraceae bacterium CG2_30_10_405]